MIRFPIYAKIKNVPNHQPVQYATPKVVKLVNIILTVGLLVDISNKSVGSNKTPPRQLRGQQLVLYFVRSP